MEQYMSLIEGSVVAAALVGGIKGVIRGRKRFYLENLHITPLIKTRLEAYQFMRKKRILMGEFFVKGALPISLKILSLTTAIAASQVAVQHLSLSKDKNIELIQSSIAGSLASILVVPLLSFTFHNRKFIIPNAKDAVFGALLGFFFELYRSTNKSLQMSPPSPKCNTSN